MLESREDGLVVIRRDLQVLGGVQVREVGGLLQIADEHGRHYYAGIICERRAKAQLKRGGLHAGYIAYDWFKEAMDHFEKAAAIRPPGNDGAILRWNTCARILMANPRLLPAPEETSRSWLE